MGFFAAAQKPTLRSTDPQDRLNALGRLGDDRQDQLADLARTDADARVRIAAANRVTDNRRLQDLLTATDADVQRVARERLAGVAVKLALGQPLDRCRAVLEGITDQKPLAELTCSATDPAVRAAALDRLLAQDEPSPALLVMIAVQDAVGELGLKAVERIPRKSQLKDVARKAKHAAVRAAAEKRAEALAEEMAKPSAEKIRKARMADIEAILPTALRLALSSDWERTAGEWPGLFACRDAALARHPEVPLDEATQALVVRIDRAHAEFISRRQTEDERRVAVRAAYERMLADLVGRSPVTEDQVAERSRLLAAWQAVGELPSSERELYESRFRLALERLFPAIPVAAPMTAEVSDPLASLSQAERIELEALSIESEQYAQSTDWRTAQDHFRVLHKRWNLLAATLPYEHPLKTRFLAAYATFKERHALWRGERRDATTQRLAELEACVREAEGLAQAVPAGDAAAKAHFAAIRTLQARWRSVGPVRNDLIKPLRDRFLAMIDAAYAPVRELREAEDWERFQHLAQADALSVEVEALATVDDLAAVAKAVKQAQAKWKELGPLPSDRREAAWQRFHAACDAQFTRCKPHFDQLDAQRQANLAAKQALIAEVEAVVASSANPIGLSGSPADIAARREAVDKMKAFQQRWKEIGPVPREHDEAMWTQFRGLCDTFFTRHKGDLDARRQEQQRNLGLKLALCQEAEDLATAIETALAAGDEKKIRPAPERLRAVKELQVGWKSIGHVPREQVDAVWARFRGACDRVYATCQEHLAQQEESRKQSLAKKEALLTELEELLAHENARWFKDDMLDLQRQWREAGHIPREAMDAHNARAHALFDRMFSLMETQTRE